MTNSSGLERSFIIIDPKSGTCYGELMGANAALVAGYINAITGRLPRGEMLRGYKVGQETVSLGQIVVGYGIKIYVATAGTAFKHIPVKDIENILNFGKYRDGVLEFLKTGDTTKFPPDTLEKLSKLRTFVEIPKQTKIDLSNASPTQVDILAAIKSLKGEGMCGETPSFEYFTESDDGKLTRVAVSREELEKKMREREVALLS
jgi:hypothetical protein